MHNFFFHLAKLSIQILEICNIFTALCILFYFLFGFLSGFFDLANGIQTSLIAILIRFLISYTKLLTPIVNWIGFRFEPRHFLLHYFFFSCTHAVFVMPLIALLVKFEWKLKAHNSLTSSFQNVLEVFCLGSPSIFDSG